MTRVVMTGRRIHRSERFIGKGRKQNEEGSGGKWMEDEG
jgi:hypothetical protein